MKSESERKEKEEKNFEEIIEIEVKLRSFLNGERT